MEKCTFLWVTDLVHENVQHCSTDALFQALKHWKEYTVKVDGELMFLKRW